ncbi:hypothetical protein ATB93_06500 [Sphingomonas sp. WG]|nr:hypothetical protein ATB93_06500 [Sphingomonas sp. WG]
MFGSLMLAPTAWGQAADSAAIAAQQAAVKKLDWMRGLWRGKAETLTPDGPIEMTQTERIGTILDGTLLVIEGKAYGTDGSVPFHAFGVVSYNQASGKYVLASHAQGRSGSFPLSLTDTGFTWEVPAGPNALARYTATFAGGVYVEVGDYVTEGQPPRRFFTMTLKRVGDTDWPAAGGLSKD